MTVEPLDLGSPSDRATDDEGFESDTSVRRDRLTLGALTIPLRP